MNKNVADTPPSFFDVGVSATFLLVATSSSSVSSVTCDELERVEYLVDGVLMFSVGTLFFFL